MGKDGRILIPKLVLSLSRSKENRLACYVMDISIEPPQCVAAINFSAFLFLGGVLFFSLM